MADQSTRKAEALAGFCRRERAGRFGMRGDIAYPQSEKRRRAEVEVHEEIRGPAGGLDCGAAAVLQQTETQYQPERPEGKKEQQGERSEEGEERFAALVAAQQPRHRRPGPPGHAVVHTGQAYSAGHAAGENHGLKRVPKNREQQGKSREKCQYDGVHRSPGGIKAFDSTRPGKDILDSARLHMLTPCPPSRSAKCNAKPSDEPSSPGATDNDDGWGTD